MWDEFKNIQCQLEDHLTEEDLIANGDTERESFENRYHKIAGLFKHFIKHPYFSPPSEATQPSSSESELNSNERLNAGQSHLSASNPGPSAPTSETQAGNQSQSNKNTFITSNSSRNVTNYNAGFEFPKLQAPIFHGGYDTWLTFHDSFKSMCHDNPSLSPIQKFHYLKACLKEQAAEVIASLEITTNNYEVAWDLLTTRYDNRNFIVNSHIKALFEIPHVSKEFSVQALLDHVQGRIRALRALGQPVDQWDWILIFIIRGKLNNYMRER